MALAPDLYHGELAAHDEMDKASHLMQSLPPDRAGRDMSGAVDYLAGHPAVTGKGIGVVGFCMGGMLSFIIAANRPDKVKAVVPFYGFPQGAAEPDWSKLTATISGHMAENDDFFRPRPRTRSKPSCEAWARTSRSRCIPAPVTRSWGRTTRWARSTKRSPRRSGRRRCRS